MHGVVERGADEIVHGRVDDDEFLGAIFLGIEHAHEHHARGGDERAAGLQEQMTSERAKNRGDRLGIIDGRERLLVGVADAEAAAEIEVVQLDAGIAPVRDSSEPCA